MVGLIAFALGALAVVGLITIGFMKALRRWNAEIPGLLIANVLSFMTATIIGGFTLADGPDPVVAEAFVQYFLPQLVVLLWTLIAGSASRRQGAMQPPSGWDLTLDTRSGILVPTLSGRQPG